MALVERLSNLGYMAVGKETTNGTAVIPSFFVPLYKETMTTDTMLDLDNPIVGVKYKSYAVYQGQREHKGQVTVMGEPNTAGHLFNMLLNKTSTTGSGDPYTHTFSSTTSSDAATYTVELYKGLHAFRYAGVKATQISPTFNKNKMELAVDLSALSSFTVREVASVTNSGSPYTITFATTYDPSPTTGLVVGDIMQAYIVASGTYLNFTVASVPTGTTITTTTDIHTLVANDLISLRGQTVSLNTQTPFLWSRSEFRFAADATTALSATQTNVEPGSSWTIKHEVNSAGGEHRSGSLDPASIARLQTDSSTKIKFFFDDPQSLDRMMAVGNRALVVRHFSGANDELRITFDQITPKAGAVPPLEAGKLLYADIDFIPVYNTSNSEGFGVKVLNNLATV